MINKEVIENIIFLYVGKLKILLHLGIPRPICPTKYHDRSKVVYTGFSKVVPEKNVILYLKSVITEKKKLQ